MKVQRGAYNSAAMLVASLGRAASQWLLLWLFAWNGGADSAGVYALALGIAAPIFIVLELGLRNVYITSHEARSFSTYFRIRIAASCLAIGVTAGIAWVLYSENMGVVLLVALVKSLDSILDIAFASLQVRGRIYSIALAMLLNSFVTIVAAAAFYFLFSSLEAALLGSLLASLVTAAICVVPVLRFESKDPRATGLTRSVRPILRDGVPLGLSTGMTTLLSYIPLYFIAFVGNEEAAGIFAVMIYFITFANLFYNSVQKAVLHTIVHAYMNRGLDGMLKRLRRVSAPLILFGITAALFVGFFGSKLLALIYGPSFTVDASVLWPIAISILVLPFIYTTGMLLLTYNVYWMQTIINGFSVVVVVGLGFTLLNGFSLGTAAILTLSGIACRAVVGIAASIVYSVRSDTHNRKGTLSKIGPS
ncbi:lipopolysaccharide biosynthesis protein [Arthrobacter pigmenti]